MPAGDYEGLVKDAEYSDSKAGNANGALCRRPGRPALRGVPLQPACSPRPALWKLRNLIVAAGKTIPKKKVKLSAAVLNSIIGKTVGITLEDDEYEGKMRSQIVGCFPASDLPDDSDVPDDDTDDDVEDPEEDEEPRPGQEVHEEGGPPSRRRRRSWRKRRRSWTSSTSTTCRAPHPG
jgi:hypothetical protein